MAASGAPGVPLEVVRVELNPAAPQWAATCLGQLVPINTVAMRYAQAALRRPSLRRRARDSRHRDAGMAHCASTQTRIHTSLVPGHPLLPSQRALL